MLYIKPERLTHALRNLDEWRKSAHNQGSMHLLPLLALLEEGAGPGKQILFNETPQEFDFWDRYFKLNDGDKAKPYFNPLTLKRAEKGYPHSNSATIRKNTFDLKWHAAQREAKGSDDYWKLADDFADKFRDNVLSKGGNVTRVPVVDLAVVMLRNKVFPDGADAQSLETAFRDAFKLSDDDYEKLFVFKSEPADQLFQQQQPAGGYDDAITQALVSTDPKSGPIPTVPAPPGQLDPDDPVLLEVQQILKLGTSGIIFSGAPGTGKSYYAKHISHALTVTPDLDVFRVQFHPSYGYEDFVEGYSPEDTAKSGFKIVDKLFLLACSRARNVSSLVVLLVDEINRGDPARIFGELMTYLERDYRGQEFTLPFSGKSVSIPPNLLMLGTMNPHDRSVSHIDAAFVRRFDHIEMAPSREVAEALLESGGGFSTEQVTLVGDWFERAQALVPFGLGHSFFEGVQNVDELKLVWRYRIRPTAATAVEVNEGRLDDLTKSFDALVERLEGQAGAA